MDNAVGHLPPAEHPCRECTRGTCDGRTHRPIDEPLDRPGKEDRWSDPVATMSVPSRSDGDGSWAAWRSWRCWLRRHRPVRVRSRRPATVRPTAPWRPTPADRCCPSSDWVTPFLGLWAACPPAVATLTCSGKRGMVEHMVGRVPDEIRQRPRPHAPGDLAGVVRPHRREVRLAVLVKPSRRERALFGDPQPDLLREFLTLGADGVADDPVAVPSSPARAFFSHLRRDPCSDPVEERPAGPQQRDPALEFRLAHRSLLGRRGREGHAMEVDRTRTDLVLQDVEGPGGVELARHPGKACDRPVPLPIGLERLQGELGCPGASAPPRPVDAEGHRPLVLGPAFDDGADGHSLQT